MPADWDRHSKKAGYLRNSAMAEHADTLIALTARPLTSSARKFGPEHCAAITAFSPWLVVTLRLSLPGLPPSSTGARTEGPCNPLTPASYRPGLFLAIDNNHGKEKPCLNSQTPSTPLHSAPRLTFFAACSARPPNISIKGNISPPAAHSFLLTTMPRM